MVGAFYFEAFTVVDAAGNVEDHGVVEVVRAGKGLVEMELLVAKTKSQDKMKIVEDLAGLVS